MKYLGILKCRLDEKEQFQDVTAGFSHSSTLHVLRSDCSVMLSTVVGLIHFLTWSGEENVDVWWTWFASATQRSFEATWKCCSNVLTEECCVQFEWSTQRQPTQFNMCSVQLHILRLPALMVMTRVLIFYPQIFFLASGTIAQSCCKCRCLNFLLASLFPSGPPLYAVLCPDWIKGAGMTEHLILSFTARAGGGETWVTDLTLFYSHDCYRAL